MAWQGLSATHLNNLWTKVFPRIVSTVWRSDNSNYLCDEDPNVCINNVFGRGVKDQLNYTMAYYPLYGKAMPTFMTQIFGNIPGSVKRLTNMQDRLAEKRDELKEQIINANTGIAECILVETVHDELALILERFYGFHQAGDMFQRVSDYETYLGTLTSVPGINLNTLKNRIAALKDFVDSTNPGFGYNVPANTDLVNFPDEERVLPRELTIQFEVSLCYDYVLSDNTLYLPWPEQPYEEQEIYKMYVIRKVATAAMRIPGLAQNASKTSSGLGGITLATGSAGNPDEARCQSIESLIASLKEDGAGIWFISGEQVQQLLLGVPRIVAGIWAEIERFEHFTLLFHNFDDVTSAEFIVADTLSKTVQQQVAKPPNVGNTTDRLIWETEERTTFSNFTETLDNQKQLLQVRLTQIADSKADAMDLIEAVISTALPGGDVLILSRIARAIDAIRADQLLEASDEIKEALVAAKKGKLQLTDTTAQTEVQKVIDELEAGALASSARTPSVVLEPAWNAIRLQLARSFRNFFEEQLEFDFPLKLFVNFTNDEDDYTFSNIKDTPTGFKGTLTIPIPRRPNIEEMYKSWANGESSVPTFTNTNGGG